MIIIKKSNFDNGSTTFPKAPGLGKAIGEFIEDGCYNINRGSYDSAFSVNNIVIETRDLLANFFNYSKAKNVIFTSGITQSLNMIIKGLIKENDHVITTSMEHNAVVRVLAQLEDIIEISSIKADKYGYFNIDDFEKAIKSNTKAMIVNHVSNVVGSILDITVLGEICKKHDIILIVDTAQSAGRLKIDIERDNIGILAFTGHKGLLGPQGIGGFIIKDEYTTSLIPVNVGGSGSQSDSDTMPDFLPDKYEAGTLNLPGIIGLHHAVSYLNEEGIEKIHTKELELAQYFIENIQDIDDLSIITDSNLKNCCAIVSISFSKVDNAEVAFRLDDEYGIMTRCGLHCAYKAHQTLNTYPQGTIRFAFGYWNTFEEIDVAVKAIKEIINDFI